MKSIKEMANEYVSGFHSSIQRMCKESFEDGANYVIGEIEKYRIEHIVCNSGLARIIEQLKK